MDVVHRPATPDVHNNIPQIHLKPNGQVLARNIFYIATDFFVNY